MSRAAGWEGGRGRDEGAGGGRRGGEPHVEWIVWSVWFACRILCMQVQIRAMCVARTPGRGEALGGRAPRRLMEEPPAGARFIVLGGEHKYSLYLNALMPNA